MKLTSVINAGHFYLTLSKSTVVESKSTFERDMNAFYNSGHIPKLSSPPPVGTYCVGTVGSKWVRVQVISSFFMAKKVEALLLDYGHFVLLSFSSLRKMRADFLDIPFQAVECCLANITPRNGDCFFSLPETSAFQNLAEKENLRAINRRVRHGISYVELFVDKDNTQTSINQILAKCRVTNWTEMGF